MNNLRKLRKKLMSLQCEICDKEFKSNTALRNHFNIVHKLMKEHQCNICQSVFKLQSQLTSHMKTTHENKKYYHKCVLCEKSFSNVLLRRMTFHISHIYDTSYFHELFSHVNLIDSEA